jgi:hypothetical protein
MYIFSVFCLIFLIFCARIGQFADEARKLRVPTHELHKCRQDGRLDFKSWPPDGRRTQRALVSCIYKEKKIKRIRSRTEKEER